MPPYWSDGDCAVHLGDCREVLAEMPEASVDSIVTDPPYELSFMSRSWDASGVAFDVATWTACLRVLKPGGHLLAFGAPRTWHRLAVAVEDAGFEIRDSLQWVYGSGFPKSLDVSKAIDKAAGAARPVVGANPLASKQTPKNGTAALGDFAGVGDLTAPATEDAKRWSGWGTALKPGWEPIILARKPLDGTVAANVVRYGTGALNIDASRVPLGGERPPTGSGDRRGSQVYAQDEWTRTRMSNGGNVTPAAGRWPTNVVLAHDPGCVEGGPCQPDCPVAELDRQSGVRRAGGDVSGNEPSSPAKDVYGQYGRTSFAKRRDEGGASRFFPTFRYEAKAPASERPKLARTVMRLRPDLTDEQRAYVLAELRKAGVNVG